MAASSGQLKTVEVEQPVTRCSKCMKVAKNCCGGCHATWYCSRECQVADRPLHERDCKSGRLGLIKQYWPKSYPMFPRRASLTEERMGVFATSLIKAETLLIWESSPRFIPREGVKPKIMWKLEKKRMPELFKVLEKDPALEDKPDEQYCQYIRRHGYFIPDTQEYAFCFGTAFFRHDCNPNCHITPVVLPSSAKDKYIFRVVALRHILPNEELTIPFHEACPVGTYEYRRQCLKDFYGFDCTCATCAAGPESDNNQARLRVQEAFERIRLISASNHIGLGVPHEVKQVFEKLEHEITPLITDPKLFAISIPLLNVNILKLRYLKSLNIVDEKTLGTTLHQIQLLQTENCSLYKDLKAYENGNSVSE